MKDKIIKITLFGCIFLHLMLVGLGAFYVEIAPEIPGKDIVDFYRKASGADSSYGFFAPTIGGKTRAVFDIIDPKGRKLENISLAFESEREAQIRMGGIYDEFTSEDAEDASFRKPLAASLAAAIFSEHADASQVILRVQEYWPNTMEEYREGQRAQWSDYYAARFARTREQGSLQ